MALTPSKISSNHDLDFWGPSFGITNNDFTDSTLESIQSLLEYLQDWHLDSLDTDNKEQITNQLLDHKFRFALTNEDSTIDSFQSLLSYLQNLHLDSSENEEESLQINLDLQRTSSEETKLKMVVDSVIVESKHEEDHSKYILQMNTSPSPPCYHRMVRLLFHHHQDSRKHGRGKRHSRFSPDLHKTFKRSMKRH